MPSVHKDLGSTLSTTSRQKTSYPRRATVLLLPPHPQLLSCWPSSSQRALWLRLCRVSNHFVFEVRNMLGLRTTGAPRRAQGSYLSLGPMCRHGWFRHPEAVFRWAPQAEVGSGDHRPGQGFSGARCTWGALCRTRPLTSSRPVKERHVLRVQEVAAPPFPVVFSPCRPTDLHFLLISDVIGTRK